MGFDHLDSARAAQSVQDARARTKVARQKLKDEITRSRETEDKFHNNLALFSGGTIALSITYLGYLKNTAGKTMIHPGVLIAAWVSLLVCAVASLFYPLLSSYRARFAWRGTYVRSLAEQKATEFQQMLGGLAIPEEKQEDKKRLTPAEAKASSRDRKWAKMKLRESVFRGLLTGLRWVARLAFPIGLGLLTFFAARNI